MTVILRPSVDTLHAHVRASVHEYASYIALHAWRSTLLSLFFLSCYSCLSWQRHVRIHGLVWPLLATGLDR
jgi:hypothetical protein